MPCWRLLALKLAACYTVQAAATWLLEQAPAQLLAQQAAWQDARDAAAAAREAEAQQQRLVKKQLVERFDLQVVPCSGGGGRSKACRAPELLPLASGKHAPPDDKVGIAMCLLQLPQHVADVARLCCCCCALHVRLPRCATGMAAS